MFQQSCLEENPLQNFDYKALSSSVTSEDSLGRAPFTILLLGEGNLTFAHSLVKKLSKSKVFGRYRPYPREKTGRNSSMEKATGKEECPGLLHKKDVCDRRSASTCMTTTPGYASSLMSSPFPSLVMREMYVFVQVTTLDSLVDVIHKYPETTPILKYLCTKTRLRIEVLGNVNATELLETFSPTNSFCFAKGGNSSSLEASLSSLIQQCASPGGVPTSKSATATSFDGNRNLVSLSSSLTDEKESPYVSPCISARCDTKKVGFRAEVFCDGNDRKVSSSNNFSYPYLIVFNNPHIGIENFTRHHSLLSHFFASARSLIDLSNFATESILHASSHDVFTTLSNETIKEEGGKSTSFAGFTSIPSLHFPFLSEVVVALCDDQPKRWNLFGAAKRAGFVCLVAVPLVSSEYPSYSNKRHQSDSGFPFQEMIQYYFLRNSNELASVEKWNVSKNSAVLVHQQQYDDLIDEFDLTVGNMLHDWHKYWGNTAIPAESQAISLVDDEDARTCYQHCSSNVAISKSPERYSIVRKKNCHYLAENNTSIDVSHLSLFTVLRGSIFKNKKFEKENKDLSTILASQKDTNADFKETKTSRKRYIFPPFPVLHPSLAFYSTFCSTDDKDHSIDGSKKQSFVFLEGENTDGDCGKRTFLKARGCTDDIPFSNVSPLVPSSFMSLLKEKKKEENFCPYIPLAHLLPLLRLQLIIEKQHYNMKKEETTSLLFEELSIPNGSSKISGEEKKCKEATEKRMKRKSSPESKKENEISIALTEIALPAPPHLSPAHLGRPLTALEDKKLLRFRQLYSQRKKNITHADTFTGNLPNSVAKGFVPSCNGSNDVVTNKASENERDVRTLMEARLDLPEQLSEGNIANKSLKFNMCSSTAFGTRVMLESFKEAQCESIVTEDAGCRQQEVCRICDVNFPNKEAYELHLKYLSPTCLASSFQYLTCSCCEPPRRFVDERALRQHEVKKTN